MKKLMMATALMGALAAFAADGEMQQITFGGTIEPGTVIDAGDPAANVKIERKKLPKGAKRAETQAKMVGIVKKYGLDDAQAVALLKELEGVLMSGRDRPKRRPAGDKRPAAKPSDAPACPNGDCPPPPPPEEGK